MIDEEEGELIYIEEDDDKEEAGQENQEEQDNDDLYRKLTEDELSDCDVEIIVIYFVDCFFKCYYNEKIQFSFSFRLFNMCLFYTSLAKSYASNFVQNLFSLSASFGFHSPPLLTFKID